ncbi:MAG TPA: glycosyltransferase [Candidatus Limnocylindrales bacterium]
MSTPAPSVSLVLPAYHSAAYIAEHVLRAVTFFDTAGIRGEVIVADDGSRDGTAERVPTLPNVRVLRLPHRGKGHALRKGMVVATGSIQGFTDADLPYGLEPITSAARWIGEHHYHAVIGDRTLPGSRYESAGAGRTVLSGIASFTFRTVVTGGIYDTQCGFKFFRGDVAQEIFRLARIDGFAIDVELIYLLLRNRLDIKRIPVRLEDHGGPSSVRVVRDSMTAMRDVLAIRGNRASGRYESPSLVDILRRDSGVDTADQV